METRYEYRPVRYFMLAFTLTWIPWFFAVYFSAQAPRETFGHVLNFVGLLGPMIMALYFVYGSRSPALKQDFKDRLINFRRLNPRYLLVTILLMPVAMGLAIWISLFFGQSADQYQFIEDSLKWLPIILLAPTLEELAWRGYAVDSLRSKLSMLSSSVMFGVLWALWHAPLFFMKGTYHYDLANMGAIYVINFFVSVIPAGIIANWLYYKHNRSIIAGILFHFVVNVVAINFSAAQFTKCIVTVIYIAFAILIILVDRKAFSEGKRNFIEEA